MLIFLHSVSPSPWRSARASLILAGSRCHGCVRACKLPEVVFPGTQTRMAPDGPRGVGGLSSAGVSSSVEEEGTGGGRGGRLGGR